MDLQNLLLANMSQILRSKFMAKTVNVTFAYQKNWGGGEMTRQYGIYYVCHIFISLQHKLFARSDFVQIHFLSRKGTQFR